jgi:hypothetical protein
VQAEHRSEELSGHKKEAIPGRTQEARS